MGARSPLLEALGHGSRLSRTILRRLASARPALGNRLHFGARLRRDDGGKKRRNEKVARVAYAAEDRTNPSERRYPYVRNHLPHFAEIRRMPTHPQAMQLPSFFRCGFIRLCPRLRRVPAINP